MQPNNQQGPRNIQPIHDQPLQPLQPPAAGPVQPLAPTPGATPPLDQAALEKMLNEPTQQSNAPFAPQQIATAEQLAAQEPPLVEQEFSAEPEEEYDEEELSDEPVTWQAQEYIHREKGTMWFFLFALVIIGLIAISVFTQAWSFTVLTVVIALVVVVYSRRPPRDLTYSITDEGLTIDGTLHKFSTFKSFGIIHDGEEFSVMLIPTQRFQPGISVYFPEEAGEDIVDMLGSRLPMKDLKLDAVDHVVRFLRL